MDIFSGYITYTDQNNQYIYVPSVSGKYNFALQNMVSGFEVKLHVYDSLGYKVGGYSGAENGDVVGVEMNAGEEYTIRLVQYSGYGYYEVCVSK